MNNMSRYFLCFVAGIFASSAAFAQVDASRFNAKQPIEITSDSLEVAQQENMATFVGNVVAIQGEVRLKADKMTVYYAKPAEKKTEKNQQAIKKIDVTGNVFLSTSQETASGASGTYDVVAQEIRLNNNVVLTRGPNVLKGNALTYNFTSGRSVISGGDVAESGASKGKERVRALFVPEKKEGAQ